MNTLRNKIVFAYYAVDHFELLLFVLLLVVCVVTEVAGFSQLLAVHFLLGLYCERLYRQVYRASLLLRLLRFKQQNPSKCGVAAEDDD